MNTHNKLFALLLAPVLMAAPVVAHAQQGPQQGGGNQGGYRGGDNHGGPGGGNHGGPGGNHGGPGGPNGGPRGNWHDDRAHWNNYYRNDAMRWAGRRGRPRFYSGYRIPRSYSIQPVPPGYYNGYAALPPGYSYGYYDGYVVSYNPVTRIIADVLDLATR
ncbi:MAG: hypothetical protein PW735_09805 [Acidobacteriaceae bacterium]|nr:hypothetical protein [Acidobacteriaceae bacterium]